jgi:hypothetical protein
MPIEANVAFPERDSTAKYPYLKIKTTAPHLIRFTKTLVTPVAILPRRSSLFSARSSAAVFFLAKRGRGSYVG